MGTVFVRAARKTGGFTFCCVEKCSYPASRSKCGKTWLELLLLASLCTTIVRPKKRPHPKATRLHNSLINKTNMKKSRTHRLKYAGEIFLRRKKVKSNFSTNSSTRCNPSRLSNLWDEKARLKTRCTERTSILLNKWVFLKSKKWKWKSRLLFGNQISTKLGTKSLLLWFRKLRSTSRS